MGWVRPTYSSVFWKSKITRFSKKGIELIMTNNNLDYNQEYKYGFTTDIENIKAPILKLKKKIKRPRQKYHN